MAPGVLFGHMRGFRGSVITAALVAGACVGAAQAQLGDVGERTQADTDYTPVAKTSIRWQWFSGAKYAASGPRPENVPGHSQTPFELDLFDVAFRDKLEFTESDLGFAGGAECPERVPGQATA